MQEVKKLIKEGIEFHPEGLKLKGFKIPDPGTEVLKIKVEEA